MPQGYVHLLVFDADSNLVSSQVQTQQLSAAGGHGPLLDGFAEGVSNA